MTRRSLALVAVLAAAVLTTSFSADTPEASVFSGMRWRLVGPTRAGRVWAVAGVPGDAAVYYIGTPAGGLWKSTNGGTTWVPASASIPVTGIGAVAVSPSNPRVVYVGTGSNAIGDGVYRSDDAGATWRHAGLADTKYIAALVVDPANPDLVIAGAGSGGNFGSMVFYNNNPTPTRGVYRTTDGGRTWAHTLCPGDGASVIDLAADPGQPKVVFASFAASPPAGKDAGRPGPAIYRSDDEGSTWTRVAGEGLPADAASASIAVAPGTGARRLYALAGGQASRGLYRSDDGGTRWRLMTSRIASAGGHLYVDPRDPDLVYTMGTSMYRSADGGRTLAAYKGAPGGDDEHALWIDPTNPRRMIVGADQGPAISLDAGASWTPWYTVPNGEHYYVSTDDHFPYWIYVAQQDSGTVAIRSRSDFGAIRSNDWYPVSGYEQGHIFADPLDWRYVYSHGDAHTVVRFDRETGQSVPVYTPAAGDRFGPRPGFALSPKDPRWMFLGAQYVLASTDRLHWRRLSPDLTVREGAAQPPAPARGVPGGRPGGATIVALAPSPLDVNLLWAGTSNGLVRLTRDGGRTWADVSPPRLAADPTLTLWSLEASPHDEGVAYAAAIDLSDRRAPCIFRTRDFGRSWDLVVRGLPADVPTRVVREDPRQATLLYAGTQAGMFVSFDRGDDWQPLQLNLPIAGVNDITVHGDDLVIATWGRGIWVLDDVSPLRQAGEARAATGPAFLFAPAAATRVRWDENRDTPLPPEVLTGQNPPDGAIIDYYLPAAAAGPVTVTIRDARGEVVRQFSSVAPPASHQVPNVPEYWFAPPEVLGTSAGMHRFAWDLRYPTPPSLDYGADGNPASSVSYGIIAPAILGHSPRQQPMGPLAQPGAYRVELSVGGRTLSRELIVRNDPRSVATPDDLAAQVGEARALAAGIANSRDAIEIVRSLRAAAGERAVSAGATPAVKAAVAAFDRAAVEAIAGLARGRALGEQLAALEFGDLRPTGSTVAAISETCGRADAALGRARGLVANDLASLDAALRAAGLPQVAAPAGLPARACGR